MNEPLVYLSLTNIDGSQLILEVHQIESFSQIGDMTDVGTKSGAFFTVEQGIEELLETVGRVMEMSEGGTL